MGSERHENEKSGSLGWVLALLAIPPLYLLSVSPLAYTVGRPPWFQAYVAPYIWLCENTPLLAPLEAYNQWVGEKIRDWHFKR
jgi:hypothetical protein